MPGICTSSCAIFASRLTSIWLKNQLGKPNGNKWLFWLKLRASFQTPAVALGFSKLGCFENKEVESALVAKYVITLDECLA